MTALSSIGLGFFASSTSKPPSPAVALHADSHRLVSGLGLDSFERSILDDRIGASSLSNVLSLLL
jgi:hypothetical protein